MKKISIIIPAYNEERRIGRTLKEYSQFFEIIKKSGFFDYEIVVVINNTKDRTERIVKEAKNKNKNIKYLNLPEAGKGNAVIKGFVDALKRKNDLIGFVDADMATRPEEFFALIENIREKGGCIASRYIKGAVISPAPSMRRLIAKKMFNTLVRSILFLPYQDTQCGAKIFTRKSIEKSISLVTMSQWAFDVDLLYSMRKRGVIIKEIPTKWSDQEYSTINFWKAGPRMALGVIRLRIINSPFKFLVRVYDKGSGIFGKFI